MTSSMVSLAPAARSGSDGSQLRPCGKHSPSGVKVEYNVAASAVCEHAQAEAEAHPWNDRRRHASRTLVVHLLLSVHRPPIWMNLND